MNDIIITSKFTVYQNSSELSTLENNLLLKAIQARNNAYAPYSKFCVGVALLLEDGTIIQGNNQENAAYPSGICAERVAIWSAASQFPNLKISKIFIYAKSKNGMVDKPVSPCGACRQAIAEYEFKQAQNIEILFTGETGKILKSNSIIDLLPLAFDNSLL